MANKLRDIFSEDMFDMGGKITFKDHDSYIKFTEALKLAQDTGEMVKVDGVKGITTTLKSGKRNYPLLEQSNIIEMVIGAAKEEVPINIETKYGNKTLQFYRYETSEGLVIENDKKSIVYVKITVLKNHVDTTFTYRSQPEFAQSVEEVVEAYETMVSLLNHIFKYENPKPKEPQEPMIYVARSYFLRAIEFYEKLNTIEKELGLQITPKAEDGLEEEESDVEEIFALLFENKIFRYNAKLNATETTGIKMEGVSKIPEIGSKIDITFTGKISYSFWGNKITLFAAELLSNAVIKSIEENDDGTTKLRYDEDESNPMFISYSAFRTEEEAKIETKKIMEHKDDYVNAITLVEYLNQREESVN